MSGSIETQGFDTLQSSDVTAEPVHQQTRRSSSMRLFEFCPVGQVDKQPRQGPQSPVKVGRIGTLDKLFELPTHEATDAYSKQAVEEGVACVQVLCHGKSGPHGTDGLIKLAPGNLQTHLQGKKVHEPAILVQILRYCFIICLS